MSERTNILLVDDRPERLLSYEVILERLEQNLVRATSGKEAYARLKEREFAAILLDVSMPGLDGFETASLIRKDPQIGRTPIIFVTGVHLSEGDRLRGYQMGAADYVNVPVVPEILRSKINVLVQLDLQRRELAQLNRRLAAVNDELAEAHARAQAESVRELQRLNGNLEQANSHLQTEVAERTRAESLLIENGRRKDEFISVLGHELRNPLAAMQSGVDLLYETSAAETGLPWARDLLQRQLRHLKRLIDELLDVSRIKTGRVRLQREILDLGEVIRHSVDATRTLVNERGHDLAVELAARPVFVYGDPLRLTQIFSNLLANAAKFTEPGGSIRLSAQVADQPSQSVVVRVTDNGTGIAADMLEQIFELFTQARGDDARNRSGLGIGLALVRGLVELHDGSVRAISDGPGCGAEFLVTLPLVEAPANRQAESQRPHHPATGMPVRLLVIDDNADMTSGLKMYLDRKRGFKVRVENTGQEGIDAIPEFRPDVVLLDIGLPDLDGYEVARQIRQQEEFRRVPLIALSGFSGDAYRRRASAAGFDRFVVKPVEMGTLYDLLRQTLAPVGGRAAS